MPQPFRLPIIELSNDRAVQGRLTPLIHAARVVTLAMLLVGLHRFADLRSQAAGRSAPDTIDLSAALSVHHEAASIEPIDSDESVYRLLDTKGESLAIVTQTSPYSDTIVGYAGPSNLLIVMNDNLEVQSVRLLRCPDTTEHLQMIENNRDYWNQFVGWKWGETTKVEVDGVTGSTLTSLAIGEAVAWRLSNKPGRTTQPAPLVRRSLRFSSPIDIALMNRWFETAVLVREHSTLPFVLECLDESGKLVGTVIRSGPLDDSVVGYQGPTEVILRLEHSISESQADVGSDVSGLMVVDAMLGETFDNQPYVNYVKQERSFWKRFRNRSVQSLAAIDFDAEMIDGVSGATMTSMAVAETIRSACQKWIDLSQNLARTAAVDVQQTTSTDQPKRKRSINSSRTQWLTGLSALAAIGWSRSRLRGKKRFRIAWQITMLASIGWISGNLLSLALLSGWTSGGIAWQFAPGLAMLAMVAILAPALLKGNVYCDHICPHGILQQWIRPQRARTLPTAARFALRTSAIFLVVLALFAVVQPAHINVAWIEPFDAYSSGILFSASALVLIVSLLLSRITPMGYCRLACPTGRLIDYTRRDASRHRLTIADGCLIAATASIWLIPSLLSI